MTALLVATAVTVYAGPYVGQPLFCGGYYDATQAPWFALPISQEGVTWECWDRICIEADGKRHCGDAADAGPFGAYCVRQPTGECLPIAADVPQHLAWFRGSSTIGRVWNVTTIQETWDQFR